MSYLLVLWDVDNSVSVVRRDSKGVISIEEDLMKFKWPRKGVYEGKIIDSSDSKKDMDSRALSLTRKNYENADSDSDSNDTPESPIRKNPAKHVKQLPRKKANSEKKARIAAGDVAAKSIFQQRDTDVLQEEIQRLKNELEKSKKEVEQSRKEAEQSKKEVEQSRKELEQSKHNPISVDSPSSMSDSSDEEAFPISEYERAMLNKKKENQKLLNSLGLLQKESKTVTPKAKRRKLVTSSFADLSNEVIIKSDVKREKAPVQKIELVKNTGVLIKGLSLATVLSKAKRQPTRLLRLLMNELFSDDEMRCSTVRGKKGTLPGLDEDTMNAILCYTMAKGEEWGQPVAEEALVRQGNEKCYQHRRKPAV